MLDFKIPNLCGASANLNAVDQLFDNIIGDVFSNIEADASDIVSSLTGGLVDLDLNIASLMRNGIPSLPDINLQAEITSLVGMVGGEAINKGLELFGQFGDMLSADGKDIASLVAGAGLLLASGKDICDLVPNLTIAADGLTAPVLKANNVTQPEGNIVEEGYDALKSDVFQPVFDSLAGIVKTVTDSVSFNTNASQDYDLGNHPLHAYGGSSQEDISAHTKANASIKNAFAAVGRPIHPGVVRIARNGELNILENSVNSFLNKGLSSLTSSLTGGLVTVKI